jgi:hypothetical protein
MKSDVIQDLFEELELPNTAKFKGYVIHLPKEEEFLHSTQETNVKMVKRFCKSPEHAKLYKSAKTASQEASKCKQSTDICYLIESEGQFLVTPVDEIRE